jgi:protein HOOK3
VPISVNSSRSVICFLTESGYPQHLTQALEKQNADLVDKNASIEEEYRKVAAFKPLMESYKTQIAELESKVSARTKESEVFKFELEQTRIKLRIANEERTKDSETLELYQERVRELELQSHQRPSVTSPKTPVATVVHEDGLVTEGESMSVLEEVDDDDEGGLGEELDTVLSGTTMTDLKLQVRRLQRELEAVQKNEVDSSRILVLENLLEDANRMKARYEADYMSEHREKLVLQSAMEEIRSGKSMGDGYD